MVEANSFPVKILSVLGLTDDVLRSMDRAALQKEAEEAALFAAEEMQRQIYPVKAELADRLNERQIAQYANHLRIAKELGKWHQANGSDGANYKPDFKNENRSFGIQCQHCAHYEGEQTCQIVDGAVHKEGICRLWVIPDDLLRHRVDSVRTDAKKIRWNGLTIGITHEPGMQRFPGGNPLRSSYGVIERSYGKAEDGKSLDCYVSPNFNPDVSDSPIFRVMQVDPETSEEDEMKYFFGYSSPQEVRQEFAYHAGIARFGSVRRISPSELDPYRKDSAKQRGRSKRSSSDADRIDAEEDSDGVLSEFIYNAQVEASKAVEEWIELAGRWINGFGNLEDALSALSSEPTRLFDRLEQSKFEDTLYKTMLLADLMGRSDVMDELPRFDSLSDPLPIRQDAMPAWLKLPFQKAINYFKRKIVLPTATYKDMQEGYHDWAFSITGITRADVVEDTKWLIEKALEEGTPFDTFVQQWQRLAGRKAGWNPGERRLYTIFDTNIRAANGTGRAQQMLDPEVVARRPLLLWRWRDSPNPREHHKALHNKAIPANHQFWQKCRLPADWGCRCSAFSVTEDYCRRKGIEILDNPPDPETIAGPGFRYPIGGLSEEQKQQQIDEMIQKADPALRDRLRAKRR